MRLLIITPFPAFLSIMFLMDGNELYSFIAAIAGALLLPLAFLRDHAENMRYTPPGMSEFIRRHKRDCIIYAIGGLSLAGFGAYLLIAGISDPDILKVLFGGGCIVIGGLTTLANLIARSDFDWKTH